jgi:sugar phosphate isomerase/epimerase
MNRRDFLETGLLLPFLAQTLGWATKLETRDIGVQLYTVRELLKSNFEGTLAEVAKAGYRQVEFAGYFDRSPKDLRTLLDRLGLAAPSAHIPYSVLGEKWPGVLEDAHTLGHTYLVCPWIDDEIRQKPGGWKEAAAAFNRAAALSKQAGIQFAYHNHHFEFVPVEGKLAYDLILEQTDPELVKMEMDLCWISVAGQDPEKYFSRWPGRYPMVHVKDVKKIPARKGTTPVAFEAVFPEMTNIGNGILDWKKMLGECERAGVKYYFVENDYPKSPIEFLRASYKFLSEVQV